MTPEERIEKLERANQKLHRLVSWMIILIASAVIVGASGKAPIPDVIQAKQFVLVDQKGNVRGSMGLDGDGKAYLALFDARGKNRALLYEESYTKTGPSTPPAVRDSIYRYAIPRNVR